MSKKLLHSPDGKRKWYAENKVQEVNLVAQGWTYEPRKPKQAEAPKNKAVTPTRTTKN